MTRVSTRISAAVAQAEPIAIPTSILFIAQGTPYIAREIAERELLLIVTPEPEAVREQIASSVNMDNVRFLECETNDTWAHLFKFI